MVLRNSRRGKSQNRHSADTTSRNLNSTQAATHETEEDLKLYLSTLEQMNNEYEVRFCQPCWDLVEIWFDFNDLFITFICVLRAWHLYFDFKIIETNCCSIWQVVIFSRILTPQLSCIISFRRSPHVIIQYEPDSTNRFPPAHVMSTDANSPTYNIRMLLGLSALPDLR